MVGENIYSIYREEISRIFFFFFFKIMTGAEREWNETRNPSFLPSGRFVGPVRTFEFSGLSLPLHQASKHRFTTKYVWCSYMLLLF